MPDFWPESSSKAEAHYMQITSALLSVDERGHRRAVKSHMLHMCCESAAATFLLPGYQHDHIVLHMLAAHH